MRCSLANIDCHSLDGSWSRTVRLSTPIVLSAMLVRDHPDRPQPRLHQLRPGGGRSIRAPQTERMPALRIQMHLDRDSSFLQPSVITERVLDAIYVVILVLQQERRRRLRRDVSA